MGVDVFMRAYRECKGNDKGKSDRSAKHTSGSPSRTHIRPASRSQFHRDCGKQ